MATSKIPKIITATAKSQRFTPLVKPNLERVAVRKSLVLPLPIVIGNSLFDKHGYQRKQLN